MVGCPYRGQTGRATRTCPRTTAVGRVDSVLGHVQAILRDIGRGSDWYPVIGTGNLAASPSLSFSPRYGPGSIFRF